MRINNTLSRCVPVFILIFLSCEVFQSCKKEYSCEECLPCQLDTNFDVKDTVWRYNVGGKVFFGNLAYTDFHSNNTQFFFYGYSLQEPYGKFDLGINISPKTFNHNFYGLAVDSTTPRYGVYTTVSDIDGEFEPKGNDLRCIIKSFDLTTKTIEGAFCGTVLDTLGHDMKITNGRFKVQFP